MISEDGFIFNIDYGFIMGDEPKKRIAPQIKWTEDIAKPILADEKKFKAPFDDSGYKKLMEVCCEGFRILRSMSEGLKNLY